MTKTTWNFEEIRTVLLAAIVAALGACGDSAAGEGDGMAGSGSGGDVDGGLQTAIECTVTDDGDGTKTISCDDGTEETLADGTDGRSGEVGAAGRDCTVEDNGDGTATVSCDDDTAVTVHDGMLGLDSLIAATPEPVSSNCPMGGQRLDKGFDVDGDGVLDDDEIDVTDYLCNACGQYEAEVFKDFTAMGTSTPASLDLVELTITASPGDVGLLDLNGLGAAGGVDDSRIDGSESVKFAFDGAAYDVSYEVGLASNLDGEGPLGEATLEAFQGNDSLGVMAVSGTGTKDVSTMFGGVPVTSFVITADVDAHRLSSLTFSMCD